MVLDTPVEFLRLAVLGVTAWLEPDTAAFEAEDPGENGYWPIRNGGEDIFTRTSPKLPSPQSVDPR